MSLWNWRRPPSMGLAKACSSCPSFEKSFFSLREQIRRGSWNALGVIQELKVFTEADGSLHLCLRPTQLKQHAERENFHCLNSKYLSIIKASAKFWLLLLPSTISLALFKKQHQFVLFGIHWGTVFWDDAGEDNKDACHSEGVCKFSGVDSNWEIVQTDLKKIPAVNAMPTLTNWGSVQVGKQMAFCGCPDQQPQITFIQRCPGEIGCTFSWSVREINGNWGPRS